MNLFVKKSTAELQREAGNDGGKGLQRVLGPWSLLALGVGVIIGAGLFSITGLVAGEHTGPAIILSFVLAAICCGLAGLCYAEFASMIPIAGSAYTYSYYTMGELVAWIIGWDLVLEYAIAAITVSISWSSYFTHLLADIGWVLPEAWTLCPADGGIFNVPAAVLIVILSLVLMRGITGSSVMNAIFVALKIAIVFAFIFIGVRYIRSDNLTPFIPENTGTFGSFGISGVLRGAAIVFFAYLGFDAISTAAQETKNPRRNMPIGILGSLLICTVLYILFSLVMTGVVDYHAYAGSKSMIPAAIAVDHMGPMAADGTVTPAYPLFNKLIVLAILFGYGSVVLVTMLGQSRVFFTMSRDGLLPPFFSHLHKRWHTPAKSNALLMVFIALTAGLIPARMAGEMTSIGTLLAFTLVCLGVMVLRRTQPDAPRAFKTPLVPWIPAAGVLCCVCVMLFLPADTWIRLVLWMLIGLDIYTHYGIRHSVAAQGDRHRGGHIVIGSIGVTLGILSIITGLWHQQTVGWNEDKTLLFIACAFGVCHIFYYLVSGALKAKQ